MIRWCLILMLRLQLACAVDLSPLEQIAVQEGGRKKPFLVFAEESLLALTGKSALEIDDRKMHAMDLITSLWVTPDGWDTKAIILVNTVLEGSDWPGYVAKAVFASRAHLQQATSRTTQ